MKTWGLTTLVLMFAACVGAISPPDISNDELWDRIQQAAATEEPVVTYQANYTQEKFSPLLRDPIRSEGRVRIAGGISRWDTAPPNPTSMMIKDQELQIYYPEQQTLEVYELEGPAVRLAASPVPDFAYLRKHFALVEVFPPGGTKMKVRLRPDSDAINDAIEEVTVVIDGNRGGMQEISVTDLDGETTTLRFIDIELNPEIDPEDLILTVPEGTKLVKPLDAVEQ